MAKSNNGGEDQQEQTEGYLSRGWGWVKENWLSGIVTIIFILIVVWFIRKIWKDIFE